MKTKIALAFEKCKKEKRAALITYTVAGDNTKKNSLKILNTISKHADILELGFPHNTPIADGGQIQGSAHRALKNGLKLNGREGCAGLRRESVDFPDIQKSGNPGFDDSGSKFIHFHCFPP